MRRPISECVICEVVSLKNGVFLIGEEYLTDSCLFTQYRFSLRLSSIVLKLFIRLAKCVDEALMDLRRR